MKLAWLLVLAFATTSLGTAQDKASVGDFTKSPTEHIINRIARPFVVRSIRGSVIRREGFREPLAGVLFEVHGPDAARKIRKGTTDENGRFRIDHVPVGTYGFKATLNDFQSVMGRIIVSKKAAKVDEIKIEMPIGV
jgi:Carboxypeptidase regulatory-like domain